MSGMVAGGRVCPSVIFDSTRRREERKWVHTKARRHEGHEGSKGIAVFIALFVSSCVDLRSSLAPCENERLSRRTVFREWLALLGCRATLAMTG